MPAGFQVIDSGGTDRTITAFRVIDSGGTDRTIVEGRVIGPDGGDRVFWDTTGASSFNATASRSIINGLSSTGTVTTNTTTITPTGGTAPYFYSWAVIDHSSATPPTVTAPTSATTAATQTNMGPADFETATMSCTVTDSAIPANSTTVDVGCVFRDTTPV